VTELAQYLSIRYTERLAQAGIEPSVGSAGDSYDNALAESIIGLYKAEEIRRRGPWKGVEEVEFGVPLSSARYKQDIAALGTRSEGVLRLQPVSFAYRDEAQGVVHYGLIAEEVQAVYPELAASGEVQTGSITS